MRHLELTLAIIKPNATKLPHVVQAIRHRILRSGFYVVESKEVHLSLKQSEAFYVEHKNKFFFEKLTSFLSSGPIHSHVLAGVNSIRLWRRMLGPARVYQAKAECPNSIRALYGITDTRNTVHGSDSKESARKEIGFFFPDLDVERWHCQEEPYFISRKIEFNEDKFIHEILPQLRK